MLAELQLPFPPAPKTAINKVPLRCPEPLSYRRRLLLSAITPIDLFSPPISYPSSRTIITDFHANLALNYSEGDAPRVCERVATRPSDIWLPSASLNLGISSAGVDVWLNEPDIAIPCLFISRSCARTEFSVEFLQDGRHESGDDGET